MSSVDAFDEAMLALKEILDGTSEISFGIRKLNENRPLGFQSAVR